MINTSIVVCWIGPPGTGKIKSWYASIMTPALIHTCEVVVPVQCASDNAYSHTVDLPIIHYDNMILY